MSEFLSWAIDNRELLVRGLAAGGFVAATLLGVLLVYNVVRTVLGWASLSIRTAWKAGTGTVGLLGRVLTFAANPPAGLRVPLGYALAGSLLVSGATAIGLCVGSAKGDSLRKSPSQVLSSVASAATCNKLPPEDIKGLTTALVDAEATHPVVLPAPDPYALPDSLRGVTAGSGIAVATLGLVFLIRTLVKEKR